MQHERKENKFRQMLKKRGYYIVLFLCLIAVGASGYLYFRDSGSTAAKTAAGTQATETKNASQSASKSAADTTESGTAAKDAISGDTLPAEDMDEALSVSAPLEGETQEAYCMDKLAYNETTKDWRVHAGIDIAGELGQSVCAAADGVVYAVYEDGELGQTVVLTHSGDYTTYYSNLAEDVSVSVGEKVKAGTELGEIGQTAVAEKAQQPHLHFAVYHGKTALDPSEFLAH